jgi:hypothetical protein
MDRSTDEKTVLTYSSHDIGRVFPFREDAEICVARSLQLSRSKKTFLALAVILLVIGVAIVNSQCECSVMPYLNHSQTLPALQNPFRIS